MWGNPGLKNCQILYHSQQFTFNPLNVFGKTLNFRKNLRQYDWKTLHNPFPYSWLHSGLGFELSRSVISIHSTIQTKSSSASKEGEFFQTACCQTKHLVSRAYALGLTSNSEGWQSDWRSGLPFPSVWEIRLQIPADQKFQAGLGCSVSSVPALSSLVNLRGWWFLGTAQYPRFDSLWGDNLF